MAYKSLVLSNSNTVYQQPSKLNQFYKGFSTVDNINAGSKLYDLDLIKQDIINQFNTKKGERVMNPEFGSAIWDLLMEPMSDSVRDALSSDIQTICTSDSRATPTQINLTEYENGYLLEVTLLLNGTDQTTNMKLTFDQSVGLTVQ